MTHANDDDRVVARFVEDDIRKGSQHKAAHGRLARIGELADVRVFDERLFGGSNASPDPAGALR